MRFAELMSLEIPRQQELDSYDGLKLLPPYKWQVYATRDGSSDEFDGSLFVVFATQDNTWRTQLFGYKWERSTGKFRHKWLHGLMDIDRYRYLMTLEELLDMDEIYGS